MHHKLLTARLKHTDKTPLANKQRSLSTEDSMRSTITSDSQPGHAPLNSSLSQIVRMELGGPEQAVLQERSSQLAAFAQARLMQDEMSLSRQAQLAAAARLLAQHQSSAYQQQLEQLEQLRQLQAMQQFPFLYTQPAAPTHGSSALLMEALLARQQQQQMLAAAAAADLARASRAPIPAVTKPPVSAEPEPPTREKPAAAAAVPVAPTSAPVSSPKRAVDKVPEDLVNQSNKKQKREPTSDSEGDDDDSKGHRFRPYQYEQWTEKFQELTDFRKEKGHCQVPHTYTDNPPLARWVKRQRYQYKLKMENKQSTMTDERVQLLENIGFIWDSHAAAWAEKLHELKEYAELRGDCNVPSTYPDNPQLATWVKCQRRQYKLLRDGKTSNMTVERIKELESIGFVWEVRKSWENNRK